MPGGKYTGNGSLLPGNGHLQADCRGPGYQLQNLTLVSTMGLLSPYCAIQD